MGQIPTGEALWEAEVVEVAREDEPEEHSVGRAKRAVQPPHGSLPSPPFSMHWTMR